MGFGVGCNLFSQNTNTSSAAALTGTHKYKASEFKKASNKLINSIG
jgi:hypothetical protein